MNKTLAALDMTIRAQNGILESCMCDNITIEQSGSMCRKSSQTMPARITCRKTCACHKGRLPVWSDDESEMFDMGGGRAVEETRHGYLTLSTLQCNGANRRTEFGLNQQ